MATGDGGADEGVFTLGTASGNAEIDAVYTADNFNQWYPYQDPALATIDPVSGAYPATTPMFGFDAPGKKGAKKYTVCSYAAMLAHVLARPPAARHLYEMVKDGHPCHIYVDCDLNYGEVRGGVSDGPAAVAAAMRELVAGMRAVQKILCEAGKPGWDFVWDDESVRVEELSADREGKCSRHFIFAFPGERMFADNQQIKYFMAAAMQFIHHAHGRDRAANALYFNSSKTGALAPLVDYSVYTAYRNWRMIGQRKLDPTKPFDVASLLRVADAPRDAGLDFTDEQFLRNSPCFVPRGPDGEPVALTLLRVPHVVFPDIKNADRAMVPMATRALFPFLMGSTAVEGSGNGRLAAQLGSFSGPITGRKRPRDDAGDNDNDDDDDDDNDTGRAAPPTASLSGLVQEICDALERQLNTVCTAMPYDRKSISYLIRTESRACAAIRRMQNREHQSNHIAFVVFLAYPLPRIRYHCEDIECQADVSRRRLENIGPDMLEPDPAIFARVTRAIRAYAAEMVVTPAMLFPSLHAVDVPISAFFARHRLASAPSSAR